MAEVLNVEVRQGRGTREARRLRRNGQIPAVLYGHGEQVVSLAVGAEEMATALRHHSRLVDLKGGVNESALVRALQWDAFGQEVLHVDFTRVSADERIQVQVPVELRGDVPGAHEGGAIEHLLHEITVECVATAIPENISVNVGQMKVGDKITVGQLELPAGVTAVDDADDIVVQCVEAAVAPEPELHAPEAAEPEVIGRKEKEEEEEE